MSPAERGAAHSHASHRSVLSTGKQLDFLQHSSRLCCRHQDILGVSKLIRKLQHHRAGSSPARPRARRGMAMPGLPGSRFSSPSPLLGKLGPRRACLRNQRSRWPDSRRDPSVEEGLFRCLRGTRVARYCSHGASVRTRTSPPDPASAMTRALRRLLRHAFGPHVLVCTRGSRLLLRGNKGETARIPLYADSRCR